MLLRIDDTDPQRNVPGGEEEIIRDLEWLGLAWEEGPIRQSERQDRYREAGAVLGERFDGITLLREDGTAGKAVFRNRPSHQNTSAIKMPMPLK
jgi:glutamyl-tRNA synthetase